MARKIPVADKAIAEAALSALIHQENGMDPAEAWPLAEQMVRAASKVRFQPSTRQLVLTFDLGMSPSDPPVDQD